MNLQRSLQTPPTLEDVLATLETALDDLDLLELSMPAVHLSMAIELLRIELDRSKTD